MRVSLSRTLASRVPSNVRNSAVEPSGRSTDGGLPDVMPITSMRAQRTLRLLSAAAVVVLVLSACTPPSAISQPAAAPPTVAGAGTSGTWTSPARTKTTGCTSQGGLPDGSCTPGAVDPRVSPATESTTICKSGYTATVRPSVSVTEPIKREQMAAYGLTGQPLAAEELDHLIPLELGGASDVANLWPEPWNGDANAHMKDAVETYLNREVCRGTVQLAEAQREIATDWLTVYRSRGLTPAQ